ncbi:MULTISPECIES: oligopeptide/dipeptide ABC transporter ATP-binding protein [Pseudomonas syringae group]|uniref:oligopeptide/dipeptide ABC transporter ATP-binding protein n=1 Tax=Pseudomonas syringae group TaxID=136849 RepID=UPI000CF6742A|nr:MULTISPECIES: ABC transporter ATP-binding protein [Pseudomonas syringae group]AVI87916.1 peptide ABC transporter ATP-binding protein [Pseudomonas syringae pv. tomato]MBX6415604.1 ABC transporter ATP-binding protein [Pseudomonas syringae pv. tomato]MBX6451621.1 ABC transporter ATP-binding protein [Pseudomonas syringae pv. tomato]MBX6609422.1 ABC transporter ATP-binding protein [Pseudomonas syringae pv. tomato]MBX6937151.1 ABC transporter ATP-binding protein [Pseudomonas syringae pv. tomato]
MNNATIYTIAKEAATVLQLNEVRVRFPVSNDWLGRPRGYAHALNGIDLQVRAGETLGIVGESGCGKSTLAQVLLGLVAPSSGELKWTERRGEGSSNIQIVLQDPQSSLDPRLPIWKIITEPLYVRGNAPHEQMRDVAARVAAQVGIRPEYIDRFPHQFSGGQRQRIAIARAISSDPDIIVLDEPTSALDISVQAQILNLLAELQETRKLTYILISHNVSVVRHMSTRIAVMYLGQIVELGGAAQVLDKPCHPYTQLLLEAVPRLGAAPKTESIAATIELPGNRKLPSGCFFRDRCSQHTTGCDKPQSLIESERQFVRCHLQKR